MSCLILSHGFGIPHSRAESGGRSSVYETEGHRFESCRARFSGSEEALPGGATLRDGNLLPVTAQRLVLGQIIRPSELAVAARFAVMQVEQLPDSFVQLAALRVPRQQELLGAGAAAKGR
jgi:hypothetical protein